MNNKLLNWINNPNQDNAISLADWYYEIGQTASALNYYLRATEFLDNLKTYYSLCRISMCLNIQGNRLTHSKSTLLQAISLFPERPEAYHLLSKVCEWKKEWIESYSYANIGLKCNEILPIEGIDWIGVEGLLFQKAVSGWWIGKQEEALSIFLDLENSNLNESYKNSLKRNLDLYNLIEVTEKIDVVIQGPYLEITNKVIERFLSLPFVNNVILSHWEGESDYIGFSKRVVDIKSKIPNSVGTNNINLQLVSSLNGLKQVSTKWSAKFRSDQLPHTTSLYAMWDFFIKNKNEKIICGGIYPNLLFHPKDHFFWGKTDNLIKLFDIPYETINLHDKIKINDKYELSNYYDSFVRAETYIGTHYCSNFLPEIKKILINSKDFLYDGSKYWNESKKISDDIFLNYFIPFPKECSNLEWQKLGWENYPFDSQYNNFGERWFEDIS